MVSIEVKMSAVSWTESWRVLILFTPNKKAKILKLKYTYVI